MHEPETNMAAPETVQAARVSGEKLPVDADRLTKETSSPVDTTSVDKPIARPTWKGVMVPCAELKAHLDSLKTFDRKNMLRKGREVHKIYVEMTKGETFLDDQFAYTEFGKMVLTNGTVRAGRAKNAKQIVVARETLYCSGTGACKRMCGGYGECVPGCDKSKMRGHRCGYRIKLTQRLGYVNYWFVEELGSHEQLRPMLASGLALDNSFKSSPCSSSQDMAMDLSSEKLVLFGNREGSASPVVRRDKSPSGNMPNLVPENLDVSNEYPTQYHYTLGLLPTTSDESVPNSMDPGSSSTSTPVLQSVESSPADPSQTLSQQALEMYRQMMVANSQVQLVIPTTPPKSVEAYQSLSSPLQQHLSPVLVRVKQEPVESSQQYPGEMCLTPPTQNTSSPIQISPQGLPSPKPNQASQNEVKSHYVPSQPPQLQPQPRIGERAKSRKSARTLRIPQKRRTPENCNIIGISNNTEDVQVKDLSGNTANYTAIQTMNRNAILQASAESYQNACVQFVEAQPQLQQFVVNTSISQQSSGVNGAAVVSPPKQLHQQQQQQMTDLVRARLWEELQNRRAALMGTSQTAPAKSECLPNGHVEDLTKKEKSPPANIYVNGQQENGNSNGKRSLLTKNDTVAGRDRIFQEQSVFSKTNSYQTKDLVCRVRQLEAHVQQLQNLVIKKQEGEDGGKTLAKKGKPPREFDFTKYNTRHVALKVAYLGWDYGGFAVQEDTNKTIEAALFDALIRTKMIEARETSNYHRCGRTDKGVSAFGQVISIDLRTNLLEGPGVKIREGGTAHNRPGDKTSEIRYVHILNKVLPPEIKVLAWAPVDPEFSARFSCKKRTYKYFFPKGNLDIKLIEMAAEKLVGEHDYRNLCKMDVGNGVVNYTRRIVSADIEVLDERENGYQMCELTIVGLAFLWHQIRCIVSVLLLIGEGKESPEIIEELLDIEKHPRKPQYTMASEIPLVLFDSDFGDSLEWIYEADWQEDNIKHLQQLWAQHMVKATMIKRMLEELDSAKVETETDIAPWGDLSAPILHQCEWLIPGNKPKVYKPLFDRPTCESLEDRLEHFAKRRKIAESSEVGISNPE